MSTLAVIKTIKDTITFVNALIELTGNGQDYRDLIAKAVAENREVSEHELDVLEEEMFQALDAAKKD